MQNTTLPTVAFVTIAFAIGLVLLAILVLLRMELTASGLHYLCGEGGPDFCFVSAAQATTMSQVPLEFFATFVFLPAFLAVLAARIVKMLPPEVAIWGVLAMWFAVACYACVLVLSVYFSTPFSAQTGWVLYPPLSTASLSSYLAGSPNALQLNALTVAVLLILVFSTSAFLTWGQQRTNLLKAARMGGVAFLCGTIWMMIANLGRLITMVSLDRNFGTTFFAPDAQAQKSVPAQITEYLATPAIWCGVIAVSCVALWILTRQIMRSTDSRLTG